MNKDDFWRLYNQFYLTRLKAVTPKLTEIIEEQYSQALQTGDVNNLPIQPLYDLLKKLYGDAARIWGNKTRQYIRENKNVTLGLGNLGQMGYNQRLVELINQYFENYLFEDVIAINETTKKELLAIFQQAFTNGLNLSQIADQINTLGLARTRAKTIARTEVNTAANRGALISAEATGLELTKVWLSARDNRVRDTHKFMDGTTIPFKQKFDVGGVKMDCPGDRGDKEAPRKEVAKQVINCRCTCLYVPKE